MSKVQTDLRRLHKHDVGVSKNGKKIYAYLTQSPLAESIGRNPHLLRLAKEITALYEPQGEVEYIQHDTGRAVGYAERVKTGPNDVIFYAKLLKADNYTRFVKNYRAPATNFLTIKIRRDEQGDYELLNIWLGKKYPAAPDAEGANGRSKSYWEDHAVVYNGQHIIASSVTKDCPY